MFVAEGVMRETELDEVLEKPHILEAEDGDGSSELHAGLETSSIYTPSLYLHGERFAGMAGIHTSGQTWHSGRILAAFLDTKQALVHGIADELVAMPYSDVSSFTVVATCSTLRMGFAIKLRFLTPYSAYCWYGHRRGPIRPVFCDFGSV